VAPEHVHVEVAEYKSQHLYVFGEVAGLQRAVPYRGPETVLDLLHRVGGLTPGAALRDIQVIRPHVADGKRPEIFRIDLPAIVLRHDPETNVILEPFDQIYIGQSRRSCLCDCLPPWLRPAYQRACGLKPGVRSQGSGVRKPMLTPDS
jgi:protein involved in polysaccharide export with SLBB domain